MKPPPSVEEMRELVKKEVKQYPPGCDIDIACHGIARAILARVRESVHHVEMTTCKHHVEVERHWRTEGPHECRRDGSACAWEEPR